MAHRRSGLAVLGLLLLLSTLVTLGGADETRQLKAGHLNALSAAARKGAAAKAAEEAERPGEGEDDEEEQEGEEETEEEEDSSTFVTKNGRRKRRRRKPADTDFVNQAHAIDGSIPQTPLCPCVNTSKPVVRPLRWLHIPKCGEIPLRRPSSSTYPQRRTHGQRAHRRFSSLLGSLPLTCPRVHRHVLRPRARLLRLPPGAFEHTDPRRSRLRDPLNSRRDQHGSAEPAFEGQGASRFPSQDG